jgi:hypothetical protein
LAAVIDSREPSGMCVMAKAGIRKSRIGKKTAMARQAAKIAEIRRELASAGYNTVREQAEVLGLRRSTAWAVLRTNSEKLGISSATIKRMLASPHLPLTVRKVIREYVRERLLGRYGHPRSSIRAFRRKLKKAK